MNAPSCLIRYEIWMCQYFSKCLNPVSGHFSASLICAESARWLYALLARLEKPLHQDMAAVIRQLFRRCCALRAGLNSSEAARCSSRSSSDELSPEDETNLALLNTLIVITGSYFGQGEIYVVFHSDESNEKDDPAINAMEEGVEHEEEGGDEDYDEYEYGDDEYEDEDKDCYGEGIGVFTATNLSGTLKSQDGDFGRLAAGKEGEELEDGEEQESEIDIGEAASGGQDVL